MSEAPDPFPVLGKEVVAEIDPCWGGEGEKDVTRGLENVEAVWEKNRVERKNKIFADK